uniref:Caspase recruitment domain-containing protein n=1 Tax=Gadus morhua TaxID=8049 RepID=A0A8C4ZMH5_GADMO
QMSFVSDQLYSGYIRTHMSEIVSKVKVREIIPHLPCLTLSDREEVEAKREHNGNFNAMQLLLQSLHRRENWPEQFIAALVACEHRSMAAEIEAEYRRLKTPRRESPPPSRSLTTHWELKRKTSLESVFVLFPFPPAPKASTVVMATVHSPPAVSPSDPTGASSSSLPETPEAPWAQTAPPPKAAAPTPVSPPATLPARQEPEENAEEPREWVGAAVGSGFTAVDGAGREVPAQTGSPAPTWSPAPTGSPAQPESMVTWRSGEQSGDDDSSGVGDGSFASGDDSSACGDDSSEEDLESASSTLTPEKLPVQESAPPKVNPPSPPSIPNTGRIIRLEKASSHGLN